MMTMIADSSGLLIRLRDSLEEPFFAAVAHGLRRRILNAQRIVDDYSITAGTSDGAGCYRLAEACRRCFELGLLILVFGYLELDRPIVTDTNQIR